jgi:hypothetical protein
MRVVLREPVDLFGVSAGTARCGVHVAAGGASRAYHLAPSVTAMDLIDIETSRPGPLESVSDLFPLVPAGTDHWGLPSSNDDLAMLKLLQVAGGGGGGGGGAGGGAGAGASGGAILHRPVQECTTGFMARGAAKAAHNARGR